MLRICKEDMESHHSAMVIVFVIASMHAKLQCSDVRAFGVKM